MDTDLGMTLSIHKVFSRQPMSTALPNLTVFKLSRTSEAETVVLVTLAAMFQF